MGDGGRPHPELYVFRFFCPRAGPTFPRAMEMAFVDIGEREFEIAAEAYTQFGKGRHPAGLNMGDCFAYACARANGARLLFKGQDFARTDIEPAMP